MIQPGSKLAHDEVVSALEKGGMGEVWLARDSKLGREVAIKTLPEKFARYEERLARFEREAKLPASLKHPNIATIHGIEEDNGTQFLVLELVKGETVAEVLEAGPLPVESASSRRCWCLSAGLRWRAASPLAFCRTARDALFGL